MLQLGRTDSKVVVSDGVFYSTNSKIDSIELCENYLISYEKKTGQLVIHNLENEETKVIKVDIVAIHTWKMICFIAKKDHSIIAIDIASALKIGSIPHAHKNYITSLKAHSSNLLFSASADKVSYAWDLKELISRQSIQSTSAQQRRFSNETIITKPLYQFIGHTEQINTLEIVERSLYTPFMLITGSADMSVIAWDILKSEALFTVPQHHTDWINRVSHHNNIIYSSSLDKSICAWDITNGSFLRKYEVTGVPEYFEIHENDTDSSLIVSHQNQISIFKLKSGKLKLSLVGHTAKIVAFKVYEDFIISSSLDCTLRKWNLKSGSCMFVFQSHFQPVSSFARKEDVLFSASDDGSILLWNLFPTDRNLLSTSDFLSSSDPTVYSHHITSSSSSPPSSNETHLKSSLSSSVTSIEDIENNSNNNANVNNNNNSGESSNKSANSVTLKLQEKKPTPSEPFDLVDKPIYNRGAINININPQLKERLQHSPSNSPTSSSLDIKKSLYQSLSKAPIKQQYQPGSFSSFNSLSNSLEQSDIIIGSKKENSFNNSFVDGIHAPPSTPSANSSFDSRAEPLVMNLDDKIWDRPTHRSNLVMTSSNNNEEEDSGSSSDFTPPSPLVSKMVAPPVSPASFSHQPNINKYLKKVFSSPEVKSQLSSLND